MVHSDDPSTVGDLFASASWCPTFQRVHARPHARPPARPPVDRCYLLCSFIQVLSLLAADVASITEQVLQSEELNRTEGEFEEGDNNDFMERFIVKHTKKATEKDEDQMPKNSSGKLEALFVSAGEMEIRALVSALELGNAATSRFRAMALLQRARLRFDIFAESRTSQTQNVQLLETALVTFLPDDNVSDNDVYGTISPGAGLCGLLVGSGVPPNPECTK